MTLSADSLPRAALRGPMRITCNYIRHNTGIVFRNATFVVFTVLLPIIMFLIFRMMFADQGYSSSDMYAWLMAAYGGFAGALNAGAQIQIERASGWMRQLNYGSPATDG